MTQIYKVGTATVSNGSTTVAGTDTGWATALVTGGLFIKDGLSVPIESVDGEESLTLALPWPGSGGTGVYSITLENSAAASVVNLTQKLTEATITLSLHSLHPNFVGTLAEIEALDLTPEDTEFVAARLEDGQPDEYYRWGGTDWVGPFPIRGTGDPGEDGANAYVYVAYASDASGTGFTTTFNPALDYIAILSTDTEIAVPAVGDFAGLWKNYKGAPGENFEPDEVVPLIADRDAFDDEPKMFAVLVESDAGNDDQPTLYFKLSAASADWSAGFTFIGGGSSDAVLTTDTDASGFGFVEKDDMASNSDEKLPSTSWIVARAGYIDVREENVQEDVASDQSAGLIAAYTRGMNEGKEVVLPVGNIRSDQQLPLLSGLRLIGRDQRAVLDFSNAGAISAMISGSGSLGSSVTTTADADPGADQITATDHGLAVGDWFRSISTIDANSSGAGDLRLGDRADVVPFVETCQVAEVISSSVVRIRGALRFSYPTGSTIRKITPIVRPRLRELAINAGGLELVPLRAELVQGLRLDDVEIRNPYLGTSVPTIIRGCFDAPTITRFKAHLAPDGSEATNGQLLKINDGSTGVLIEDPDLANGGQMIDITYTPSNALVAPALDTTIRGGVFRGAGAFSAVTDHPGCMGTSVLGATFQGVRSAVYIRSRNAIVQGNRAYGTREFSESNSVAFWFGENGYWSGATLANNLAVGFRSGYLIAGAGATIPREMLDTGNIARDVDVGMELGNSTSSMGDVGFKSRDLRIERAATTGITINGAGDGIDLQGFQIRGPVTNAGIEIAGDLLDATIKGEVIDLGASIPALKVASGTPARGDIDIKRRGDCGLNSGVTRAMVQLREKVLYSFVGSVAGPSDTADNTVLSAFYTIPKGAFDECARLKCLIKGIVTGTNGTKNIRLKVGTSTWSPTFALPSTANGAFNVAFEIAGSGAAAQQAFATFEADGVTTPDPVGPTSRSLNLAGGGTLNLSVQLANASDGIAIRSLELIGSWA